MSDELGLNAADLEDLEAAADRLLAHEDRIYVIHHELSGMEAVEWIEMYNRAVANDPTAVRGMLGFLHLFAERLNEMMSVPDELIDDYNDSSLDYGYDPDEDG